MTGELHCIDSTLHLSQHVHCHVIVTVLIQFFLQIFRCIASFIFSYFFRCSGTNNLTALGSSFGSHINNMICHFNDIQVMFNHNYRISFIYQPVQYFEQYPDIFKMKSGCGFIQNIQGFSGIFFRKFSSQFDPLRFATRKVVEGCPSVI